MRLENSFAKSLCCKLIPLAVVVLQAHPFLLRLPKWSSCACNV